MTESKKVWVKPELIVLVRSKPEEAVLVGCKTTGSALVVATNNVGCAGPGCSSGEAWSAS